MSVSVLHSSHTHAAMLDQAMCSGGIPFFFILARMICRVLTASSSRTVQSCVRAHSIYCSPAKLASAASIDTRTAGWNEVLLSVSMFR